MIDIIDMDSLSHEDTKNTKVFASNLAVEITAIYRQNWANIAVKSDDLERLFEIIEKWDTFLWMTFDFDPCRISILWSSFMEFSFFFLL